MTPSPTPPTTTTSSHKTQERPAAAVDPQRQQNQKQAWKDYLEQLHLCESGSDILYPLLMRKCQGLNNHNSNASKTWPRTWVWNDAATTTTTTTIRTVEIKWTSPVSQRRPRRDAPGN
uniref:Uncharacterized protein n=1 Tax=Entomoneis paludosa TaxID=265537 RepID=A0A7S3DRV7_9STRA|mmetsp:Transcript_31937/g.66645  ORF Transcript_31937/g.66645 Transcript_31937/m.66645 type:complete len:118 (+) Transcript_31937:145-498(+)|eukprot:CAMPEP_0172462004 /NCGR_PEP_ID=MMETSP1065-20121228/42428_1 /TAXON_ID=265537 /ORGANISM="Amphiprora paludosa, Strain CCMP125" /LENGTH=117 /DNA_ID=CAMNT_0013217531 /DNA_START=130 /DNA_END=483 /DNA_ORIENTATION=-